MNQSPINPDFMPLLQGLRPFLGAKGQNLTDITLNFFDMVSSDVGRQTVQMLNSSMNVEVESCGGSSLNPLSYAFSLFLILILLILSSSTLSPPCGAVTMEAGLEDVPETVEEVSEGY